MSDAGFVVIFMSILLGILCWYVLKIKGISDKYYGEYSFVKVPTVFEVNFFNTIGFFTVMFIFISLMGLFFIFYLFIKPIPDILANISIVFVSLLFFLLSGLEFYKIYICLQLNGSPKSYFFEPENRKLTIQSDSDFVFVKDDIIEVIRYCFGNERRNFSVLVFCIKNQEKVVFTEILPFYFYLDEFYGELKTSIVYLKPKELNQYFRWFKSLK